MQDLVDRKPLLQKISNDEWSVVIPGKVIAGKQKIFAYLLGKEGKVLIKAL